MRLEILVPTHTVLEASTDRVGAQGLHGSFTLLPHHIDTLVPLAQGILVYGPHDQEEYVAVDGGILVKRGSDVVVSTRIAVAGKSPDELSRNLEKMLAERWEEEREARVVLNRIGTDVVQRLVELNEKAH